MDMPHALMLPYPAQGHVIPLMELAHCLVERGFKITFINTEFNHNRVIAALSKTGDDGDRIHLVTVPDGLEPDEDRNNIGRLTEGISNVVPGCLEQLIRSITKKAEEKITCFIVDWSVARMLEVAHKMNLRSAAFWLANPAMLVATLAIPKLTEDGIIDKYGRVKREEMIYLNPGMPAINTTHLLWNCFGDSKTLEIMYNFTMKNNLPAEIIEFLIYNSFDEVDRSLFIHDPKLLPVGPLLTHEHFTKPAGHFWPENSTCMYWLDHQQASSVIYVAFGSLTIFSQHQFEELALGLELKLTGRPFLRAVRPDLTASSSDASNHGFRDIASTRGKIVSWCPQQRVLAHHSIACFISHCGWSSTTEGVGNGIPFLCWPYFADQFLNESYICDVWRVGLSLTHNEGGIISRKQIRSKLEELLSDPELRMRALSLKEMIKKRISKGGSSYENLSTFAKAMKESRLGSRDPIL